MVRKLSIDEWQKTRKSPDFEGFKKDNSESYGNQGPRPIGSLRHRVVAGFILGAIIGAGLGFYFYGDFSLWWFRGGLVGLTLMVVKSAIKKAGE